MKIKTGSEDQATIDWLDKMAKYFRRSRSQQIMWLLRQLMKIQQKDDSLISRSEIFNGKNTPKTT